MAEGDGLIMGRILGAAILAVLAGCAWLQPAPAPAPPAPAQAEFEQEVREVTALLAYYQQLMGMPAEEQRREHLAAGQVFARDKTEFGRLRLALTLAVPGATWRDDARLASLLEGVGGRSPAAESPRKQFANVLARLAAERLREQRRADEQQRRADEQQRRADEQQRRADEQQRRADELQQKLDAMLEIERKLRGRQKTRP
jgi:hypothetical protein